MSSIIMFLFCFRPSSRKSCSHSWPLSFLRTQAPFTRCSSGARLRIRAAQSVCHPSPFVGQRLLSFLRCSCPVRLVVGATSLPTTARVEALRAPRQGVSDDVPIAGLRLILSGSLRVLARRGPGHGKTKINSTTYICLPFGGI